MIEIKLKLIADSFDLGKVYVPNKIDPIFLHCTNDKSFIEKHSIEYYGQIFNAHGYKLVFPITCEDTGTLWRVSDGVEFRKNENGKYFMVESEMHRPHEYDFEVLNDGYNFTSNKQEIKNEKN